jgi:hypothetical protein
MSARMWRHGIHAFLELFRYLQPPSILIHESSISYTLSIPCHRFGSCRIACLCYEPIYEDHDYLSFFSILGLFSFRIFGLQICYAGSNVALWA